MKRSKILIVEDEGVLAKGYEKKLVTLGYAVAGVAFSGKEALRMVEEKKPDLILMDIKLKGKMDGVETARQIRERFNIPVVYLTAYGDGKFIKRVKITEPYGYIIKPVGERELHCNIEIALYKHKMETDISRKKELEALGIFSIGLTHDFNNLIQIIDGLIQVAQEACSININEKKCAPSLQKARERVHTAAELVKTYEDIFKGDPLFKREIMLPGIIDKAISDISRPQDGNISFHLDLDENQVAIPGDETRLKEVFSNLLLNAVEAMNPQKGGKITITAEDITLGPENSLLLKQGTYVKVSIRDEGEGIPAENLKKVFIPYFSTKDNFTKKGLGLGLTICYSIIKRHDGHIDIESETHKGTTVNVYLPAYTNPGK